MVTDAKKAANKRYYERNRARRILAAGLNKRRRRLENPERERECDRLYHQRYRKSDKWKDSRRVELRRAINRKAVRAWQARNPEKVHARRVVHRLLKEGLLRRFPCELCGNESSEAHHYDYSKPAEVIWLCRIHHKSADEHRRIAEQ